MDYPEGGEPVPPPRAVPESELAQLLNTTSGIHGRILLVENIRGPITALLGELLDIEPIFFAGHIITDFQDIENAPPPPSLALFPSEIAKRGHLHLHYQQVLDLGCSEAFQSTPYNLKSDANAPRTIRLLPSLSGRQLAICRACCSMLVKKRQDSWICLVLVDPPVGVVIERLQPGGQKVYPSQLLHGGFGDIWQAASFSSFRSGTGDERLGQKTILNYLLHSFQNAPPPGFRATDPVILSLGYYPMRIVLADWNVYMHLMSRYFKYYEYALHDIENRLHDDDIIDLQRWRRRWRSTEHKLVLLTEFIDYWLQREHRHTDKQPWHLVLKDIAHVQSQLEHYNRSLERVVPVATSMVQLLDSRRWMVETANVSRLTFMALVFVPLSWVASLFSMSDDYSPGHQYFWVYFATALPLLFLVILLSALRWKRLVERVKRIGT